MHPGIKVGLDLFVFIGMAVDGALMVVIAAETLDYDGGYWYNDDAYDTYKAVYPNGTRYWVPARNYTPCSGFVNCAEQTAFNDKTHHRASVELVGCAFAFVAA